MTGRARASILLAILGLVVVGCGGRTYIEGYPVGDRVCPGPGVDEWWCQSASDFARSSLDVASPGHAGVASVEAYRAAWRGPDGEAVRRTYGTAGGDGVIVFRLADGATRAYYVECIAGPSGREPTAADAHCDLASRMRGEG